MMMSTAPVTGGMRAVRGALAAVLAVGSAALAHAAAGHHNPHWVVLVLTLAVSLPVCVALSAVKLSRVRLAAAVLISQGTLHGLFALFPAAAGASSLHEVGGHQHEYQLIIGDSAEHGAAAGSSASISMTLSHLFAAAITYMLLRRGELVLAALTRLLSVRPVLLLLTDVSPLAPTGPPRPAQGGIHIPADHVWLGAGAGTLRGPPLPANCQH